MKLRQHVSPHVHQKSFDSAASPKTFAKRFKELALPYSVTTDHGSLGGCREIYDLALKEGLKPILGNEAYLRDENCPILTKYGIPKNDKGSYKDFIKYLHLTLHFKDQKAYQAGVKAISKADKRAESHGGERKPLFSWEDLEELGNYNITIGSSCLIGVVQRFLLDHDNVELATAYYEKIRSLVKPGDFIVEVFPNDCSKNWVNGVFITLEDGTVIKEYEGKKFRTDSSDEIIAIDLVKEFNRKDNKHKKLLGIKNRRTWQDLEAKDIIKIEKIEDFIQNECSPRCPDGDVQAMGNKFVIELAHKYGDKILISSDAHYAYPYEQQLHDIKLQSDGKKNFRFYGQYHFKTNEECFQHFQKTLGINQKIFEEWIDNSYEWASKFDNFNWKSTPSLPASFYPNDTIGYTYDLIKKHGRMEWDNPKYLERLKEEINLFYNNGVKNYLPYFFLGEESVDYYVQNNEITGAARGCVTGETLVITENGFKPIDEIKIGEKVYTHTGELKKVLNTMSYPVNKNEKLINLKTEYAAQNLSFTNDHKIFAYSNKELPNWNSKTRRWIKCTPSPSWIKVKDIKYGDLIYMPKVKRIIDYSLLKPIDLNIFALQSNFSENEIFYKVSLKNQFSFRSLANKIGTGKRDSIKKVKKGIIVRKRGTSDLMNSLEKELNIRGTSIKEWQNKENSKILNIPRFLTIDKDFAYCIGRWIGDGWFSSVHNDFIGIAFNSDDTKSILKIKKILNPYCITIKEHKHKTKKLIQVIFYGKILVKLFKYFFPLYKKTSNTKYIGMFKNLPDDLLESLILGLQDSDGHVRTKNIRGKSRHCIDTTSKQLRDDIKLSLLYLGIPSSIITRAPFYSGRYLCNESYKIIFKFTNKSENGYWCKVLKISEVESDKVFDITVENDHSYLTANYAVHNSSGGCLLAYLLGITHLDPIKWNTSLARFMTLDRIKSGKDPDIDIDFPHRDLILKLLNTKFNGHYAQIGTDSKLKLRSAVKDVHRALYKEVPKVVEELTKQFENAPQGIEDIDHVLGYHTDEGEVQGSIERDEALKEYVKRFPKEWETVKGLLGLCKVPHGGRHASGFIITDQPIDGFIPLVTISEETCTQYTMESLEAVGALKMDYLVVRSLNDISNCIKLVQQKYNNEMPSDLIINKRKVPKVRLLPFEGSFYDIWDLPEKQEVFKNIVEGDTKTVFQFDSESALMGLKHFNYNKPNGNKLLDSIKGMAIFTALDRPGTLNAFVKHEGSEHNMLVEYTRRLRGLERASGIEAIEGLLPETQDTIIYQEQIQYIYQYFTGCSNSEAEAFRSDIAKKKKAKIAKAYSLFIERALEKVNKERAQGVWNSIETASEYAFNYSHSVGYAIIGYACAFLKHYYPLEWWCSVLKNASKNDVTEKFWRHCSHMIDMPEISSSMENFTIVNNRIVAPLDLIQGIGEKAHYELAQGRPYRDIYDFCEKIQKYKENNKTINDKGKERLATSALNKKVVYNLILAGTMNSLFPENTSFFEQLQKYEEAMAHVSNKKQVPVSNKYIKLTPLERHQLVKKIFPIYNQNLIPLIKDFNVEGLIFDESNNTVSYNNKKDLFFIKNWKGFNAVLSLGGYGPQHYGVVAYIKGQRIFKWGENKEKESCEIILDIEGNEYKTVKWPNRNSNKISPIYKINLVGSIALVLLLRYKSDRPFSVEDIITIQEPLKEEGENDESE